MRVERTVAGLRDAVAGWRADGQTVALVPTMGALHEGHLSLVRTARREAGRVIASIFVNPTQFGPREDFGAYPRQEEADLTLLRAEGADLAYLPTVVQMYPAGFATAVSVSGLDRRWEGEQRPGHFSGVATVVSKLLIQAGPDTAIFGEKDYQQLQVIRRLALDLDLPARIVGVPTARDAEGLALSSRNAYLTADQLAVARRLNGVMRATIEAMIGGEPVEATLGSGRAALVQSGFAAVDYLAACDGATLEPLTAIGPEGARLLAAVRLGPVRLLDNMAIPPARG